MSLSPLVWACRDDYTIVSRCPPVTEHGKRRTGSIWDIRMVLSLLTG
ncbi:hypothetical protein BACCAP_02354 [Pseudoflavonifractor capillosus ATCC 29799]|uniref:Uncharacterized protein n=1 Tax=Pseudoflavonifractor capillosus ATCC 29799 TaxID=411467 RepID=A6NVW1_9FIRM|nr:hypothetical protein BACCAP_02354 [Pseudoflavonifractor capillosus ATCC 29799]